jgi:hypothetical protein
MSAGQEPTCPSTGILACPLSVRRARGGDPAWVIGLAGIAMPGLRRAVGSLVGAWRGDPADLQSEVLTGFLAAVGALDPDDLEAVPLASRLCWIFVGGESCDRRTVEQPFEKDRALQLPVKHPVARGSPGQLTTSRAATSSEPAGHDAAAGIAPDFESVDPARMPRRGVHHRPVREARSQLRTRWNATRGRAAAHPDAVAPLARRRPARRALRPPRARAPNQVGRRRSGERAGPAGPPSS